ncbi:MAG: hypothetical protein IKT44_03875 [Clostridia bacterium]|nr:hypothetical protein [Clostridia bacterium]
MKKSKALKIIGIVACVLLSIYLIISVVATSFYYSIKALTKPEAVAVVIQQVDYKQVFDANPLVKQILVKNGITSVMAENIIKSEQGGKIIEAYTKEIVEIFKSAPKDKITDASYIKELISDNKFKFVEIAEKNTEAKLSPKVVEKFIDNLLKDDAVIEKTISVITEIKDIVKSVETSRTVTNNFSFWSIILIVMAVIAVAVIIIIMHSNGFLLVGLDFAVISIILCMVIAFSKSSFISLLALEISDFGAQIIESAVSVSVDKIEVIVIGTIIMAVLFSGFFVVLKLLKKKYQKGQYIEIK